jgi:hypothetical protein
MQSGCNFEADISVEDAIRGTTFVVAQAGVNQIAGVETDSIDRLGLCSSTMWDLTDVITVLLRPGVSEHIHGETSSLEIRFPIMTADVSETRDAPPRTNGRTGPPS